MTLNIKDVQQNFKIESENLEEYRKLVIENKNEILNEEGVNQEKAKFFINNIILEFNNIKLYPRVSVNMYCGNESVETPPQNSGYKWENQLFAL